MGKISEHGALNKRTIMFQEPDGDDSGEGINILNIEKNWLRESRDGKIRR